MYDSERRSRDYYEGRARWYDWANRLASLLRGESATKERRKAIRRLNLKPGDRVLEVSVGTGTNLPLLEEQVGPDGHIVGLDISPAMLRRCRRKLRDRGLQAELVEGEAAHLPLRDGQFDAVLHHGGIAEFGDRRGAIEEMARVARPGARVVICDVGVPSDRRLSLVNRLLLKVQSDYAKPPPIDLVPPAARDVRLDWFHGGAWYMIEFVIP
jgi:ubiquinone/menaquinone biosynthesis C-methylase UbiE